MSLTDPVADFLTRVRNAVRVKHPRVDAPASNLTEEITKTLLREGYIRDYKRIDEGPQGTLRIYLAYDHTDGSSVIEGIRRVSTPGRRVYVGRNKIPRVRGGLGTAIVSTSTGVLTDKEARQAGVGGELMAEVW
jgi:small subunit ribosomal protein S8